MVFKPFAFALMALQMQQITATSLQYDPYTTCTSYDISDANFPGRGSEVKDDRRTQTCLRLPRSQLCLCQTRICCLRRQHLLPSPCTRRWGRCYFSEKDPSSEANPDAYVVEESSTATLTGSVPATSTSNRRLEWAFSDDISKLETYFGTPMETKLKNLPTSAAYSPSPWAGSNWPTYLDSINSEWNKGQPSPAEKYAKAFGLDVKMFMDNVSAQNGIDSVNDLTNCTSNNQCFDLDVETVCAKRANEILGYCIPTWWGICHAWSPASILEKEPNCPVTYNGVTFQPMDIKALVTDVYDGANFSVFFTGSRYAGSNDSIDEYGAHSDYSYRGFFHIAAANLIDMLNTTFIIDRDAGIEVWNQSVVGFKVYEQTAMTPEEAAQTFYRLESYPWNQNASSIVFVTTRLSWINETFCDGGLVASGLNENFTTGAYYDYLLELDEDEDIIGGEWLYGSNDNHPDFLWIAEQKPSADTVTSIGLSYANVTMLLDQSVECFKSASV